jgi:hypothetical protein
MKQNNFTPNQIRDLGLKYFAKYAREKYDKGQAEHQGILTDRDHLDEIMAEAVDLFWYAYAAKLKRIMTMAKLGLLTSANLHEMLRDIGCEEGAAKYFGIEEDDDGAGEA